MDAQAISAAKADELIPRSSAYGYCWHATGDELSVDYLCGNQLSANVWDDYDAILNACARAWNWLIADPDRICSIGTRELTTVSV